MLHNLILKNEILNTVNRSQTKPYVKKILHYWAENVNVEIFKMLQAVICCRGDGLIFTAGVVSCRKRFNCHALPYIAHEIVL
jgi:hypothetical protein